MRIYCLLIFIVATLAIAENPCFAPSYNEDREGFHKFVGKMVERGKLQGVSLGVVTEKGLIWDLHCGVRDRISNEPIDADTVFRIASVSKTFTSTALIRASQLKLIKCDVDLEEQFTPTGEGLLPFRLEHPRFKSTAITAELLNNFYGGFRDNAINQYYQNELSLEDFLMEIFTEKGSCQDAINWNAVAPGKARCYSNVSTALVAYVVARASGMDYEDFTRTALFNPLMMEESAWHLDDLSDKAKANLAKCYSWNGTDYVIAKNPYPYPFYPAGSLNSSVSDLANFVEMLLNDGNYRGTQILPPGIVESFGSGTYLPECDYQTSCQWYKSDDYLQTYFKMGSSYGVSSVIMVDTKRQRGYIGLANGRLEAEPGKSPVTLTEILATIICQDRAGSNFDRDDFVANVTAMLNKDAQADGSIIATCNLCHKIDYSSASNCLGCKTKPQEGSL